MGTRADFYIGIGPAAEWLGSISMDGYPDGHPEPLFACLSADAFRADVIEMFKEAGLHTRPEEGWPWPWNDSRTTDYAYAWVEGRGVLLSNFGRAWITLEQHKVNRSNDDEDEPKMLDSEVIDMADRKMNRDGVMAKSGLIIFRGRGMLLEADDEASLGPPVPKANE